MASVYYCNPISVFASPTPVPQVLDSIDRLYYFDGTLGFTPKTFYTREQVKTALNPSSTLLVHNMIYTGMRWNEVDSTAEETLDGVWYSVLMNGIIPDTFDIAANYTDPYIADDVAALMQLPLFHSLAPIQYKNYIGPKPITYGIVFYSGSTDDLAGFGNLPWPEEAEIYRSVTASILSAQAYQMNIVNTLD